jgi:microsomal epoxide hydrolase
MSVRCFEIRVPDFTLQDLQTRLAETRFAPTAGDAASWEAGSSPAYLEELVDYWRSLYDWRSREAELNRFHHFMADIDHQSVHYVHERGESAGGAAPLPLILTHGYPDSFLRFRKLIPMLTRPGDFGGHPDDAFDVVVPSLPGFAFSERPPKGGTFRVGDLWHELMTKELGYAHYGAHGGDWGSTVTEHIGRSHARSVVGIHLTDVPFWHGFQKPHDLAPEEQAYLDRQQDFTMNEGAYFMIQGMRPQTLADGLNDSPAGLAAWLVEKFQRWSDCGGDLERRFSKDELLDHFTLTWATGSIGTAFLPYYDLTHAGAGRWILEKAKDVVHHSDVPAGFAIFPKDTSRAPRAWAERFFHVHRWTEMPRGGHFTAMEEPELLARELRDFFRPLRRRLLS